MDILTQWLRSYLPALPVDDRQLAEDLTLRGIAVEGEFSVPGGSRFEMDITTNRVDAMNHYGVAREAATIYNLALQPLQEGWGAPVEEEADGPAFPVRIEAQGLCGRFTARVIRGVTVGPSKGLVNEYFQALGQKQISAPVDVTNFGWMAMGQPTHAFDLDKLEGGIVVRLAHAGEKLALLDGTTITLTAEDLVVADEKKALALAGVKGGWDSRVTEETKNILVEAAWFDPATVRASSRRHNLHTDASHRFERGADIEAPPIGNNLVTRLIVEQCGGQVAGPMTDVSTDASLMISLRAPIHVRVDEVRRHLGTTLDGKGISAATVEQFLTSLGCVLTATGVDGAYEVQLPTWRLDLEREIDLIEEVARVYGYNKFADTLPTFTGTVIELSHSEQEAAIRETLRALGFSEAISSTFASADEAALFGNASGSVAMGNPLSEEAGMLRPSLVPGMATMLAHNLHRDVSDVRLFELGTVFTGSTAHVDEATGLAIGATGAPAATSLHSANDALFYEMKAALETLLAKFNGTVTFDATDLPAWLEPGRGARALLDATPIAWFGELTSAEAHRRKLRQTCVLAEVRAAALLTRPLRQPASRELSRFQAVERDFSFIFPDAVRWEAIAAALSALNIAEMQRVSPIEIFRDPKGKAVAAGSYSALIRARFQSNDRTLTEEEILTWYNSIIATLTSLGGTQRA